MMILEADRLSIAFGGVRAIDSVSIAIARSAALNLPVELPLKNLS